MIFGCGAGGVRPKVFEAKPFFFEIDEKTTKPFLNGEIDWMRVFF